MAQFVVRAGFNLAKCLPDTQHVIVGKRCLLKNLSFGDELRKKLINVDEGVFKLAIQELTEKPSTRSMPLYMNLSSVVSVSDEISRANAPSNSSAIYKAFKGFSIAQKAQSLSIVLYASYEDVMASVCALAKSFPVYSLKSEKEPPKSIEVEVILVEGSKALTEKDVDFLQSLCDNIRTVARLVDMPANILHTEAFVEEALACVKQSGNAIKTTVIKDEELLKQGFGGIYHVGKAAVHGPVFVCFSHTPSDATQSIALVGKGIVYDTGGMQIKGRTTMPNMKCDMGGAAAVLAAFCTLVKAGFKQNLHCLLCIAENSISPYANKPDDVITLLSGKTVEINNTDAEGRLVLADGVFYAKTKLNANYIIDCATLTGAQRTATGIHHAAILSNSERVDAIAVKAGKKSGDLVHPLPFAPDMHFGDFCSKIADMKNARFADTEGPPTAIAGLFIGAQIDFGKGLDWLHVDLAGPAFSDRATGYGPALLTSLLSEHIDVEVAKMA